MNRNFLRRGVVALIAACSVLAVMAAPASADVGDGTLTSGTVTIDMQGNGGPAFDWSVGGDPDDPPGCVPASGDVAAEVEFTNVTGQGDATTEILTVNHTAVPFENTDEQGNDYYMLEVFKGAGDNTGSIDNFVVEQNLHLLATISTVNNNGGGTCLAGSHVCDVNVLLNGAFGSGDLHGTWSGDAGMTDGEFEDLATLAMDAGLAGNGTCSSPFTTWLSGGVPVTVTDLHVQIDP